MLEFKKNKLQYLGTDGMLDTLEAGGCMPLHETCNVIGYHFHTADLCRDDARSK